jgi:hypothetical protein
MQRTKLSAHAGQSAGHPKLSADKIPASVTPNTPTNGTAWDGRCVSSLTHCIYASRPSDTFRDYQLPELLAQARAANEIHGITGMLLYIDETFFQVLEGEEHAVIEVYNNIQRDPRHFQVTKIIQEPIARRSFADWSLDFETLHPLDADTMIGATDFFSGPSCIGKMDRGRAKKILAAFQNGRWRMNRTTPIAARRS